MHTHGENTAVQLKNMLGFHSVSARIITCTLIIFFIMLLAISFIGRELYWRAFYHYSNNLCLTSNAMTSHMIDGDEVERFAKTLVIDEEYKKFAARLDDLREKIHARYFYILVDNHVPGMYTYVYDAPDPDTPPEKRYALGKQEEKTDFAKAAHVLATGQGFEQAEYHNAEKYGELYYAYSPIRNSAGKVVALVGTDIDISPLRAEMAQYRLIVFCGMFCIFTTLAVVYLMMMRRLLLTPIGHITHSALRLSQGDLDLRLPHALARRKDEVGQLGSALEVVESSISGLILDIEQIMRAARNGQLAVRADLSTYQGDYYRIISGVNRTLDMICSHLDAVPEAIAFFNADGRMTYGNRAMRELGALHGLAPSDSEFLERIVTHMSGRTEADTWRSLFNRADTLPLFTRICLPDEKEGEERHYAMSLLRTGHTALLSSAPAAPPDAEERSFCIMLMLNDVTMLIRAKNEAARASRAMSDFMSSMSHEIRTPLNAIIGMSQIAHSSEEREKIYACLKHIENSSTHLLGIINDILDFSKVRAGKLELDAQEFSLTRNMDFPLSTIAPHAKAKDLSVQLRIRNIAHDLIVADALRLNQVLLNLLSNAVKFSCQGGRIDVLVEELVHEEGCSIYAFAVTDAGIGIDVQQLEKIWQPFEQAGAGVSRAYGGTGLGLAISRNIVRLMGGEISVKSALGQGSTFRFTIRALSRQGGDAAENAAPSACPPVQDFSGKRALIVDDIDINREILLELLKDTGAALETAGDGQRALEMFLASPPGWYDIILMDMQMPVMDGCAATAAIRASGRPDAGRVHILAMTANVIRKDVERALASGMNGHLGKPVILADLLKAMGKALAEERAAQRPARDTAAPAAEKPRTGV